MHDITRWGLSALLLLGVGCASGGGATRGNSADARADQLEQTNKQLREELARKQAQVDQNFNDVTRAESAAGLANLGCAGVTSAATPARNLPRSGAVHGRVKLSHQSFTLTPSFSAARATGGWKVSQGNCQVTSP